MKLTRAWLATCSRCKTTTQVYRSGSNVTQDVAESKLRDDGWRTTYGDPLCPDCVKKRPGVIEVINALKSAGKADD